MLSQMAAYSVASFAPENAKMRRRMSFAVEDADELTNVITKARLLLRRLANGLRLWVIVGGLLALAAVARLAVDATLVARGKLDDSTAIASLILSILVFGLAAIAFVAVFVTSKRVPSVLATLNVQSPLIL